MGFRDYLRGSPASAVSAAAVALILVMVCVRGWAAARGWFFYDDLGWQGLAADHDRPDRELLLTPWNGHLMPGGWLVVWLFTTLAPHHYWPVVVSALLLQAAFGWVMFLVLRRLFGSRPEILLLLTLTLFASLTLPAALWWAVGLAQLPLLLFGALAVWAHLGYLRTRRPGDAAITVAAVAGGLAFSERTLLVLPLLGVLTLGWFSGEGGPLTLLRRAVRHHWPLWAALAALGGAFSAYYLTAVPSARSPGGDAALLVDVLWEGVVHALAPAALGGPWTWTPVDPVASIADPSPLLRLLAAAVVVGVVVLSSLTWRHAARAWWLLGVAVLLGAVMLTFTRAAVVGGILGREYRYFTELALVAPLAIGLATLPLRWPSPDGSLQLVRRQRSPAVQDAIRAWLPVTEGLRRHRGRWVGAACVLLVCSATASVVRHDGNWHTNPGREYVATVRAELAASPEVRILDRPVPTRVLHPVGGPQTRISHVFRPVVEEGRVFTSGTAGEELRILDDEGRVRRLDVVGPTADDGPVAGCGWLVQSSPVTVPLDSRTFPGTWLLRLSYYTDRDSTALLTAGTTSTQVVLRSGLRSLYALVEGPVSSVRLSGLTAGASVCVTTVTVGHGQPAPPP